MRSILISTLLIIAITSCNVIATGPAADQQECSAEDYEAGECTQEVEEEAVDNSNGFVFREIEEDSSDDESSSDDDDDDIGLKVTCEDVDEKCVEYAKDGACTDNLGYMKYNCPISCDTCKAVLHAAKAAEFVDKDTFSKPCMDEDYRCMEWAGMGECDNNPK